MIADRLAAGDAAGGEKLCRGQHHPRRAEPALGGVAGLEFHLQIRDLAAVGQPFDRHDIGAVGLYRQHQAAAGDDPVDPHRTGAADAVFAGEVRSGQFQIEAEKIDQVTAHRDGSGNRLTVDGERYFSGFFCHGEIFAFAAAQGKMPGKYIGAIYRETAAAIRSISPS